MRKNKKLAMMVKVITASTVISTTSVAPGYYNAMSLATVMAGQTDSKSQLILSEIGTHQDAGMGSISNKTVTLVGKGESGFDKDYHKSDFSYLFTDVEGKSSIVAKVKNCNENATAGQIGIIARNDSEAVDTPAGGWYIDYSKNAMGVIHQNGSSLCNEKLDTLPKEFYVKLEFEDNAVYYTVSKDAEFKDCIMSRNGMGVSNFKPSTIGFFASKGLKIEATDVSIKSNGSEVFTSNVETFELNRMKSSDIGGKYEDKVKYSCELSGRGINVASDRTGASKGDIRTSTNVDYLLLPENSNNMTLRAEVVINSIDLGTDKQGLFAGQFAPNADDKFVYYDAIQFNKNNQVVHAYSNGKLSGGKKTMSDTTGKFECGKTYYIEYKKEGDQSFTTIKDANDNVLINNFRAGVSGQTPCLGKDQKVRFGFALSGVNASLSNITLSDEADKVVYSSNDQFNIAGEAPVIANAKAELSADRTNVNLNWDITKKGSGVEQYDVFVSKNGSDYNKVKTVRTNSFVYNDLSEQGTYKFKIVPYGGSTQGQEIETNEVSYVAPLDSTTLTGTATSKEVALKWNAVTGATEYEVYRTLGFNGEPTLCATVTNCEYNDKNISEEQPYVYYVVAKNNVNTSNPSNKLQLLTTDGHSGKYVYENEAAKMTVVSKDNDTLFKKAAEIKLKSDKEGTAQLVVNGKVQEEKKVKADEEFAFSAKLADKRNDVDVLLTDASGKVTRKTFNFVCNPSYDIVVDKDYMGEDGSTFEGKQTFKSVSSAVKSVLPSNKNIVIFIKNGQYNERVVVDKPNISFLGQDSQYTHIFYHAAVGDNTATTMWDRNAVYVDSKAKGFTAENLTVENSFPYGNKDGQQADAICVAADNSSFVNVRFLSYQDTVLTAARQKLNGVTVKTRQYFKKCYITGNVDFIYGSGSSYFDDCDIVARYTPYKSDGVFSAGNTPADVDYGLVFNECRFVAEDGVKDGSYRMARPWGKDDSTIFINCYLGRAINIESGQSYGDMSENLAKDARFYEYGSYGKGFVLDASRPLLTKEEALNINGSTVLDGYDYTTLLNSLYGVPAVEPEPEPQPEPQPQPEPEPQPEPQPQPEPEPQPEPQPQPEQEPQPQPKPQPQPSSGNNKPGTNPTSGNKEQEKSGSESNDSHSSHKTSTSDATRATAEKAKKVVKVIQAEEFEANVLSGDGNTRKNHNRLNNQTKSVLANDNIDNNVPAQDAQNAITDDNNASKENTDDVKIKENKVPKSAKSDKLNKTKKANKSNKVKDEDNKIKVFGIILAFVATSIIAGAVGYFLANKKRR